MRLKQCQATRVFPEQQRGIVLPIESYKLFATRRDKSLLQTVRERLKYDIGRFEILVGLISLSLASIIFSLYSRKRRLASPNDAATLLATEALTTLLSRRTSKTG